MYYQHARRRTFGEVDVGVPLVAVRLRMQLARRRAGRALAVVEQRFADVTEQVVHDAHVVEVFCRAAVVTRATGIGWRVCAEHASSQHVAVGGRVADGALRHGRWVVGVGRGGSGEVASRPQTLVTHALLAELLRVVAVRSAQVALVVMTTPTPNDADEQDDENDDDEHADDDRDQLAQSDPEQSALRHGRRRQLIAQVPARVE